MNTASQPSLITAKEKKNILWTGRRPESFAPKKTKTSAGCRTPLSLGARRPLTREHSYLPRPLENTILEDLQDLSDLPSVNNSTNISDTDEGGENSPKYDKEKNQRDHRLTSLLLSITSS